MTKIRLGITQPLGCFNFADMIIWTRVFCWKYTTGNIHTKPYLRLGWRIFNIPTSEDIDDFTDIMFDTKLYLYMLVFHRNIFGYSMKSSVILGRFRKMFGNFRLAFGQVLYIFPEILGTWSEIFGKSSKAPLSV